MNMNQFISKSHISEKLIRAVVRQSGGWDSFKEMAEDITNHGVGGGFHGWIYHADTVPFAKRNKAAIMELAQQMADDLGEPLYRMIGGFNCLKMAEGEVAEAIHNPRSDDRTQVFNALAWFAAEEVARSYCDSNRP
jgi:hypothetical protein